MRCTIKNTRRQRPRTMSAITRDLSNHTLCQPPRVIPARCQQPHTISATTHVASNHGRCQQKHSMQATTCDTVDKLNEQLLASMNSEVFTVYSADKVVDDGDAETYATEYLNTVNLSNLPPHELKLKIGAPVILLRNLSQSTGMCNGTRLHVAHISQRVVECQILSGKYINNMVMIPWILLSPSSTAELPFEFRRTQFHLRLAFAMTINKAQGQTLNHVGLCLTEPVFTHGKLYVALSRVTDGANL